MDIINETIDRKSGLVKALNYHGKRGLHLAACYNQKNDVKALMKTIIDINLRYQCNKQCEWLHSFTFCCQKEMSWDSSNAS